MVISNRSFVAFLIIIMWHVVICPGYGQLIQGSVLDKSAGTQVPFVSIYSPSTGIGTLSNDNGDFEIRVQSFPVQLIISHLNYQTDTITINNPADDYIIHLKPVTHELAPVTVSNAGYKLIQKAFDRINSDKNIIYAKAFYRQLTKNGEQSTEIQEVIYNLKLLSNKIEGVKIANARYAKLPTDNKKMYCAFVNFSYFVLAQKATSQSIPTEKSVLFPVRSDAADYYNIRVIDILEQPNGEKIAELDCQIHEDYINPAFSGRVYINTANYKLVKVQGTIPNSLGAAINNEKILTNNHVYTVDVNYTSQENTTVFNSIRVTVEFDQLIRATGEERKDRVIAFLVINDFSDKAAKGKYKPVDIHREDLKLIQSANYDPEFWRNNPVVRRTPLEESAIKAFEQQSVMGNMKFDSQ